MNAHNAKALVDKITALPQERIAEIEDFVDFLAEREDERQVHQATSAASEQAFARVWSNPEDDVYNAI